jgi:hypothetical protein
MAPVALRDAVGTAVVVVVGAPAVVGGGVEPPETGLVVVVVVGAAVEPGGAVAAGNAPSDSFTGEELKLSSPASPMTVPAMTIGAGFT